MSRITTTAFTAMACALTIALVAPIAANAAAAIPPVAPAPKPPPPGSNPYQPVVQNDATSAYQYRTRILVSPPSCQDFANQADRLFFNGALDDKTKADQLNAVGRAAATAGCLGPL